MLSDLQKQEIIIKHKNGSSIRAIAKDMNIHKNTVSLWLKRYNETGKVNRKRGSGIRIKKDVNNQ